MPPAAAPAPPQSPAPPASPAAKPDAPPAGGKGPAVPASAKPAAAKPDKPAIATIQNAYDDLEKMAATEGSPKPKPGSAAPKPDGQPKGEAGQKTDLEGDLEHQARPGDKPDGKPPEDIPVERMAPKALREAYSTGKSRIAELEAKVKEFEGKANTDHETQLKSVQQRLEEREQRLGEMEKELETHAFEKSDAFKNEFEKPYHSAWNLGRQYVASLKVTDAESGELRQGSAKDFDDLMQLSNQDPDRAAEVAEQMFGASKVAMVAPYIARVNESLAKMQEVLQERRATGAAKDKERLEQQTRQREEIGKHVQSAWSKHQSGAVEKYPQWFKPVEGDEKGNELLEKGFASSAKAFATINAVADPSLSQEERESIIASHAAIFNKAAAFSRMVYQLKSREDRIKELETELQQFKESGPGAGEGGKGGKGGNGVPDWESQLEARAR